MSLTTSGSVVGRTSITTSSVVRGFSAALLGKVGEGYTSEVFRALDVRLKRVVALKVLREPFRGQESFTQSFENEARAMARMTHPNIARVYDYDRAGGRSFMVMEYVGGRTLKAYLTEHALPAEDETRRLAEQLREGLSELRRAGITHTRMFPADILVNDAGTLKIAGLGINRAMEAAGKVAASLPLSDSQDPTPESTCGGDRDVLDVVTCGLLSGTLLSESGQWPDARSASIDTVGSTSPRDSRRPPPGGQYALGAPVSRCLAADRVAMGGISLGVAIPVARADTSEADTVMFAAISASQSGALKPNRYARPGRLAMSLLTHVPSSNYWNA